MKKIYIFIIVILAIFLRFYNLSSTARFTRDESSDLVAIKKIYDTKNITLIGSMDEGKIEVFSSLTFYLLLPFCIIFGFDPMVTVYATAVYGLITIFVLIFIFKKTHWSKPIIFLSIILTPLLESSRWAWNPHFIPFWQVLSIYILFSNLSYKYILSGILMGLTIHQHWYGVFSAVAIIPIIFILEKKFKYLWQYSLGLFTTILPFIAFDITHPPGLFITRMLYFSPLSSSGLKTNNFLSIWQNTTGLFQYLSGNNYLFGLITLCTTFIVVYKNRKIKKNIWLLPPIFQILGLSLTHSQYADRYIISAVIFYLFWLSQSQKLLIAKILTIFLILCNILNLPTILTFTDWSKNIKAQKQIISTISNHQQNNNLFNLDVLGSPDKTTKGLSFKDQLTLRNIKIKDPAEYKDIETLYIISYQDNWQKLAQDPAYELDSFRSLTPSEIIKIDNSLWYLYRISKTE